MFFSKTGIVEIKYVKLSIFPVCVVEECLKTIYSPWRLRLRMYISLSELAEYLDLPLAYIKGQVAAGNIKALHNGEEYVVSKKQFEWYKEQIDLKRKAMEQEMNEPIPEDWDAKDED